MQFKISDKIKIIKLSDIIPFEKNPKKHTPQQIELVKNSLNTNKYIQPVAIDKDNICVIGHGRIGALNEIDPEMEVEVIDLSYLDKKQCDKLRILDNRSNESAWDNDLLAVNFDDIFQGIEINTIDVNEIGFDKSEIETILKKSKYGQKEDVEDDIPEIPQMEYIKTGDLIELDRHRLLCGDSTKESNVNRLMDGKKADIFITDPPYGVNYGGKNQFLNSIDNGKRIQDDIKNDVMNEKETQDFWLKCFKIIKNVLAPIHSYYIFSPQVNGMMMMMMMIEAGIPYKHVIIWNKNNHVLGRSDYNYKHEPILYGWATKHKFYGEGQFKTSVWDVNKSLKNDLHPTMKPIELIQNMLLNSSLKENICLDVFLGSGSTLIACEKTNRICYGIEIDFYYCAVIIEQYCKYTENYNIKINGQDIDWNEYKKSINVSIDKNNG